MFKIKMLLCFKSLLTSKKMSINLKIFIIELRIINDKVDLLFLADQRIISAKRVRCIRRRKDTRERMRAL